MIKRRGKKMLTKDEDLKIVYRTKKRKKVVSIHFRFSTFFSDIGGLVFVFFLYY